MHNNTCYAIFRRLYHFGAKNQRIFSLFIYAYKMSHITSPSIFQWAKMTFFNRIKKKWKNEYSERKQKRVTMTDQSTKYFVYFNGLMLSNGLRPFLFPFARHTLNTIPFSQRNSAIDFIILAWFRNVPIWKGHTACSEWMKKKRRRNIWITILWKWVRFFGNLLHDTKWPFERWIYMPKCSCYLRWIID